MTIEKSLERIATALENPYRSAPSCAIEPTEPPPESCELPTEIPEKITKSEHVYTINDVHDAVDQFIQKGRREEAVLLMSGFGVEKIGKLKPEQYEEFTNKFNAAFNS